MTRIDTPFGELNVRELGNRRGGVVALHGFTQHGGSFEELADLLPTGLAAVDLPGHGLSAVDPIDYRTTVSVVAEYLRSFGDAVDLVGYSQGGRIALGLGLECPGLIRKLVLISASPGIASLERRRERRSSDEQLARHIEEAGVEAFVDEWLDLEIFARLSRRSEAWRRRDRHMRLDNTAAGLAAALRGYGQSAQPYLGDLLAGLFVPTLFMAGADDAKYRALAEQIAVAVPESAVALVDGAGHAVVGEQPVRVAELLQAWTEGGIR